MANATITGTASNFGSISGVLAGEAGTVAGTITGTVSGTLTGSVGVPGAGVPSGGTTGQVLKKVSNTDYDTTWGTDLASAAWGTITGTITDQTDLTAYVAAQLAGGTAVAKNLEVYVRNQSGATLTAGTIVYIDGATGNRPTVTKAQANNDANSAQTFGFIKENIANNGFGYVIVRGELENVDTSALTEGQQLYLSPTTAGTWTTTKPSAPQHLVYVGICIRAHPTQGIILVAIQNGYELNELHDVKITSVSNGQVLKYDSAQGLWVNGTDSSGVAWGGITGTLSAQTDLQTALDAKATAADFLSKAGNLSGLADLATSRSNLGLGTMATATASDYSTTTVANGLYYPLSSNPAGYLTSAPVTSVAGKTGAVTLTNTDISGLGTMATATATDYLAKAGNLSGLADLATSRSNLGLGTMATETASNYLTTATASTTYAPLASPALTGNVTITTNSTSPALVITQDGTGDVVQFKDVTSDTTYSFIDQNGKVNTVASTTTSAGFNVPHGTAPTSPVNGDIWTTTGNLWVRINGASQAVALQGSSAQLSSNNVFTNASSTYGNSTAAGTINLGTGATISGATKALNIGTGGVAGSTTNIAIGSTTGTSTTTLQGTTNGVTVAADTNSTALATTAYVVGQAGSATPLVNGTAAVGTSLRYARQDHVHPTDTSRAPLASPALTGTPTAPTAAVDTNTTQVATTAYVIGQGYLKSATASSTYAPLASPALTGTPTAPTASAGTNTTQIATTAFVQTAAPDASTTTKGKVELATISESLDGNSASLVPTVEDVQWMMMNNSFRPYFNVTGGTSGTGAATNPVPPFRYEVAGPNAAVAGNAYVQTNNYSGMSVGQGPTVFDFSKKCWVSFHLDNLSATWIGDANNELKVFWGFNSSNNGDDPTGKAIGVWKQGGSSSLWNLMVHDGTTLTKVATSSTTMPTGQIQRFTVYSDGAGTVKLYINGTEVASTSAGPTGTRADTRFWCSVKQTASAATRILAVLWYPKVSSAP